SEDAAPRAGTSDNDYYHYDPVGHRLTGERTGKVLRLGDPITIVVANVNLDERKIDFLPAQESSAKRRKPASRKKEKRAPAEPAKPAKKQSSSRSRKSRRRRSGSE
ncbi:MAG: hypothetical protein P8178_11265, partial [Candidatus Thiodiazotropha sp.]